MTEEKLNKGGELIKHIKRLIEQKEKWEEANAIHKIELNATITHCERFKYIEVDNSFVNFEDIKLLALAGIQKRIDELQKEFDAL
jgi:hypothetical protein|nr:MAG TPA: hypothetical protein [Caudoviricetes sp.]